MSPMNTATALPEPDFTRESAPEATGLTDFQDVRPRLFGIAYRMLGRAADAEDVVQDVWLRWQRTDRAQVRDGLAFLVTVTTRVSLNSVGSARARREIPVDHWLPGQVPGGEDPSLLSEQSAALADAVTLLLQRLSPTERAVFVLREAFDYPFLDIAARLGISVANARQLARRARSHLAEPRQAAVPREVHDRLLRAFLAAAQDGAVTRLETLLAEDITDAVVGGRPTRRLRAQG
ncbi:sigma-70 family RNA polymerase sigma factor [Nocardia wallacei]|uniref:sigma-70 family RNA polymerase sigma factor n=1 Tax=Nocardia wallacei TaxID=480035 RepID=UPI0024564083|nr:sigma-70 family RNA polymerase sigma factor [Nocardia wallacei]